MPLEVLLFTLLHLLVLVYWLGGDLGAFYASGLLTDPARSIEARATAAKVLSNVDMAPRTGLLLAFPTGLALAAAKGWWVVGWGWVVLSFVVAAGWIMLIWTLHLNHGQTERLKTLDLVMRACFMSALAVTGALGLTGSIGIPVFITLKICVLAVAIAMGLLIRWRLKPFGPAFAAMMSDGPSPATDAVIRKSVTGSKPFVLCVWLALVIAAWLGIATPT